jgi:putative tryptophan/tyrosine transport system substrate-binding protein
MNRRAFTMLLGGAAACPIAARADSIPVVGFLGGVMPEPYARYTAAVRGGLRESGYVEGHSLRIEERWAQGQLERLPALADELIRGKVAIIVTMGGTAVAKSAKAIGISVPIVFALGSDPVEDGLVASMNRPGDNITGVTFFSNQLIVKRLEMLREIIPNASLIAVLVNPKNARAEQDMADMRVGAAALGRQLLFLSASTSDEIDAVFPRLVGAGVGSLLVTSDAFFTSERVRLTALAARHSIPAIYGQREYVAAGGLLSYGSDVADSHRQAGIYVARILKGAKPSDLPVMQPVKFDLVINMKAAKRLGIDVPSTLLARADEVIE